MVLVEDDTGAACAAFISDRGRLVPEGYVSRADLGRLCDEHHARNGIALRVGTIEEWTERSAELVLATMVGPAWVLPPLLACANFFFSQSCHSC